MPGISAPSQSVIDDDDDWSAADIGGVIQECCHVYISDFPLQLVQRFR